MTTVAIINETTILTDAEVSSVTAALQVQVNRDFWPAWGIPAKLEFVARGQTPPRGAWQLAVLDNTDQAGALGYHDLTAEGLPLGKCFAKTDQDYGLFWSVTASHELLEMLADPDVNLTCFVQPTATTGILYAREVCDAVEDDQYSYLIGSERVSDFVLPAYFETFRTSGPFDHMGVLTAPIPQMLQGGYLGEFDVTNGSGWTQIFGEEAPRDRGRLDRAFARRQKRAMPRVQWKLSTAHA